MKGGYHIFISVDKQLASTSASASYTQRSEATQDQYIPNSLFEHLPPHSAKSSQRRNTLHNSSKQAWRNGEPSKSLNHSDYRLGPIHVDWVDFEKSFPMESPVNRKASIGKEREGKGRGMSNRYSVRDANSLNV